MKTIEWIKKYDFILKKRYGQNFLVDTSIVDKIVKKSNISKEDIVIEIGPGAGTLTEALLNTGAEVNAFEIDTDLKELLEDRFYERNNFKLTFEDFLKVNLEEFYEKKISYIANIPYNISSPILEKIFTQTPNFKQANLMVQKEFAERVFAKSGKNYSPLSIFVQTFCKVNKLLDVKKESFVPRPKIDSIVMNLVPEYKYTDYIDYSNKTELNKFFKFVHVCFSQRRKTINNNLKKLTKSPEEILKKVAIEKSLRPERITVEEFLKLFNEINKNNSEN